MPETAAAGWFPVLTAFLGFAVKSLTDWFQDRRSARREREAREASRQEQRFERRIAFQRQTLLELQEAIFDLTRSTSELYLHDSNAYKASGQWGRSSFDDELSERARLCQARASMLYVRVRDDTTRELTVKVKQYSTDVAFRSKTAAEAFNSVTNIAQVSDELNERIGELLRRMDEDMDKTS